MSARSRLKKMFKDGQSEFSHRYATWANNHNGWSKQKKMNRRTAKHIDKAAALKVSIREVDATARIARKFRQLAIWVAHETGLPTNTKLELVAEEERDES